MILTYGIEHHQGFNSSIGTFHQIQESIQSSHHRVRVLKESLVKAKANLSTAKPEITSLVESSSEYASMLDILGRMYVHTHDAGENNAYFPSEHIRQIPEQVEERISEKHFISAVDLLRDALTLINKPELDGIGALNDMKITLGNQEHSLTDILTEELHNHLYLKSPYCEDRWVVYAKNYEKTKGSESDIVSSKALVEKGKHTADKLKVPEERQMFTFLQQLDTSLQVVSCPFSDTNVS